jgi:dehydrogenase/reductase SDR family member 12
LSILSIAGFTNVGYRLHARGFDEGRIDMGDKTVVVTGATGGIGLATAVGLADLGARVVIVGRSPEKLEATQRRVPGSTSHRGDLSLMAEVRRLADEILRTHQRVDVLVNNLGVLLPERQLTAEGLEATLATNLAGHFLLTNLLLPRLIESAPARVVNVSSGGMYAARIRPRPLLSGEGGYRGAAVYAQTKRAQLILTEMWGDRLGSSGVVFHSMHPGWAKTEGVRTSLPTFNRLIRPLLRSPAQGADTVIWLASSVDAGETNGQFWFDRAPAPTHLRDSTRESREDREMLWHGLVELTGSDVGSHWVGGG